MQKEEQVSFLAEKIRQADAVLIGGGSGLSSAAGYNHYHWLPYMEAVSYTHLDVYKRQW